MTLSARLLWKNSSGSAAASNPATDTSTIWTTDIVGGIHLPLCQNDKQKISAMQLFLTSRIEKNKNPLANDIFLS
jgi:hypothetical protein